MENASFRRLHEVSNNFYPSLSHRLIRIADNGTLEVDRIEIKNSFENANKWLRLGNQMT
jgi:hypothetical protein